MKATSIKEAWLKANELFSTDYIKDEVKSERAGYDIYTSTCESNQSYICDLGDRLEVNLDNGTSTNIWIEECKYTERQLDDMLRYVDDILYHIDDEYLTLKNDDTGLKTAYQSLYQVFKNVKNICDSYFTDSYLYQKYNLNEA